MQVEEEQDLEDELYVSKSIPKDAEWLRWLQELVATKDTNILEYWRAKQFDYKTIAKIAQDHLAIPATSTALKRVFSQGGDIDIKKRNRLALKTIRELLCLRSWGIVKEDINSDDEVTE